MIVMCGKEGSEENRTQAIAKKKNKGEKWALSCQPPILKMTAPATCLATVDAKISRRDLLKILYTRVGVNWQASGPPTRTEKVAVVDRFILYTTCRARLADDAPDMSRQCETRISAVVTTMNERQTVDCWHKTCVSNVIIHY